MAAKGSGAYRLARPVVVCGALLSLCACGGGDGARLTVGAEGFEPPVVTVPAGKSFDLDVRNDTQAVQTVTVAARPPLRVLPQETGTRQVEALPVGDHLVTLKGAPYEATLRAER